uniref:Uncharacterized protein n=1 Tax=Sphaerodactylus townsendi TaxID=933632 RepID=A0ACB8F153_9SAUR
MATQACSTFDTCGKDIKYQSNFGSTKRIHTLQSGPCLVKHLRIHAQEKPFGRTATASSGKPAAKEHDESPQGGGPRHGQCSKAFTHRSTFLQHQRTHQKYPAFSCKFCSKDFNHKSNLLKHTRTMHG